MANLILLMVDVWLLGVLVAVLHSATSRLGFAPLLLVLGALMGVLESQIYVFIEPAEDLRLLVGATLFVPTIVMGILILYIANGTVPARLTIMSILGVSLLALLIRTLFRVHLDLPDSTALGLDNREVHLAPISIRETIASVLAYAADMFVIVVFYQGMKNHMRLPRFFIIGFALMAALWTDAIVFNLLARLGTDHFLRFLPGDVVAKTLAALMIWPIAAIYLIRFAPRLPDYQGDERRPTFDLLFGQFERMLLALSRTQQQLEETKVLQQQEAAYFQQLADNVEEAFWMRSPTEPGAFYINKAYERIWGMPAKEYYNNPHTWANSIHIEDRQRVINSLPLQLVGNFEIEYRIVRPGGTMRWVRDRAFPIRNLQGEVYRVAGITEDITDRKEAERAKLELEMEREKVVFLREFISEVTHDLRTPLAAIDLKIYLMQKNADVEKQRHHLEELSMLSGRMAHMIEDLMTLARLENATTLTLNFVNLGLLIQHLLDTVRPVADSKELQLVFVPPDPPLWLHCDDADLSRAVANLIHNAVHYTPMGGMSALR
jgi:PAS domain S-box-containing protein